ncbi:uncharacterized protein LOC128210893 [Mya arenaria]|uniref:uncharacterized protein LOC128210892 n=1 Tax=Mya arenaria TaxID=6604 RepID=UPI0022E0E8CD|nr:uncharacterized protein LOC128210892 [Mya arenaria]XP_052771206.1 uncharacterized protein LOC128210893 [Mya arenaria]
MVRALQVFAFVGLLATVYSACTTDSDCTSVVTCGHGEVATCSLLHGGGVGQGENQCECVHHKRQTTTHCMTDADCPNTACTGHGEYNACELAHGGGGGSGEMQCVCRHH